MTIEDRLRLLVNALPNEASIVLPVKVVCEWLNQEADDPLADLTVAQVAAQLGRTPGTVRCWIRSGDLEAYWLGKEYRVSRPALAAFRDRRRGRPVKRAAPAPTGTVGADLGAWRRVRKRKARS